MLLHIVFKPSWSFDFFPTSNNHVLIVFLFSIYRTTIYTIFLEFNFIIFIAFLESDISVFLQTLLTTTTMSYDNLA